MQEYVIFLIPGTLLSFSFFKSKQKAHPHPPWTQDGSPFRSGLASRLGDNVRFEIIDWPEGNNLPDREAGARNLSQCIKKASTQYPLARLFVIGHSHGGTVGWLGLSGDDPIFRSLSGLVCMGTPFVVCMEPRIELDRASEAVMASVMAFGFVTGAAVSLIYDLVVCTIECFSSNRWNLVSLNNWLANGVIGTIFAGVACIPVLLRIRRWAEWKTKSERLIANSKARPDPYHKMKIIRALGDETGALPILHVLSWLTCHVSEELAQRYLKSELKPVNQSWAWRNKFWMFVVLSALCPFLVSVAGVPLETAFKFCLAPRRC